jgi:hypothetical protein
MPRVYGACAARTSYASSAVPRAVRVHGDDRAVRPCQALQNVVHCRVHCTRHVHVHTRSILNPSVHANPLRGLCVAPLSDKGTPACRKTRRRMFLFSLLFTASGFRYITTSMGWMPARLLAKQ